MTTQTASILLQIVLGLGLLNVWLMRARSPTAYRGGDSRTLKEEFATYGLPGFVFYLVGVLKIGSAVLLFAGIWVERLVFPAAAMVAFLMMGALVMHWKVKDPVIKSLPALLMLVMSAVLSALSMS